METPAERYEAYCEAREREAHALHAGLERPVGQVPLEEEHAELCTGDALDGIVRERDAARDDSLRRTWTRLTLHAEECVLRARTREILSELRRVPARDLDARGHLHEQLFRARGDVLRSLGYASGLERAIARRPGVDLAHWHRAAQRYLDSTDAIYAEELRQVLPRLGVDPRKPDARDVPAIDHLGGGFDALFPGGRVLQCLGLLLGPMGIDPERIGALEIDDEERLGRVPGVARFTPVIPHEVVLSVGVYAGPSAYLSTFFAMGRALAVVFTSESLPPLRRRPFDLALDLAWGWLLSERFTDPHWLETFPAGRHSEALLRALRLRQLFAERRAAGRMLFAWELAQLPAGADPGKLADSFAEIAQAATGFSHAPPLYLDGQDGELGVIDELRGRSLARALVAHLRQRFGWQFFRERRAAELLKELWHTGSSYTVEELADELDLGALDLTAWTDALARGR